MEGGCPIMAGGECIGGVGVAGGNWEFDENASRAKRSKPSRK